MKSTIKIFAIILYFLTLISCGESGPTDKELALESKLDSLQELHTKDGKAVQEYMAAINEIQEGLAEIKEQEKILANRASGDNELQETDVETINNDIEAIRELMEANKKKIRSLRSKLKKSGAKAKEFQTTVEQLTATINEKDMELKELQAIINQKDIDLQTLNERLNEMSSNITDLEKENEEKSEIIEQQENEMNKAYYVTGTKSYLRKNKIVTKEGGFIGIGSIQKIKKDNSEFISIDIRKVDNIVLDEVSKVTLLTDHPEFAYTLEKNDKGKYINIVISDKKAFWQNSKYLVVMTR